jgi:hypothetical protein
VIFCVNFFLYVKVDLSLIRRRNAQIGKGWWREKLVINNKNNI